MRNFSSIKRARTRFGALDRVAAHFFHFAPLKRAAEATLSTDISNFERARAEAFANMPTERQVLDLICRTVAEVEHARAEFFTDFVARFQRTQAEWCREFVDRLAGRDGCFDELVARMRAELKAERLLPRRRRR
jgi:hypothetical protein